MWTSGDDFGGRWLIAGNLGWVTTELQPGNLARLVGRPVGQGSPVRSQQREPDFQYVLVKNFQL